MTKNNGKTVYKIKTGLSNIASLTGVGDNFVLNISGGYDYYIPFSTLVTAATTTISRTTATVYVGKTTTLKISCTSKTVTWFSSDKSVATVSSKGKVTAKKAGTATITATAKDGSGNKATCAVAVNNIVKLADQTISTFWSDFSDGLEIKEGQKMVLTGTTKNNSTSNWNNMIFVLYSSDDKEAHSTDSEEGIAQNYVEYFVGRADAYGWGDATYTTTSQPDDWDEWLAATQAGAEFTLTVTYSAGTIQIDCSCAGAEYVVTYSVEDASRAYYIALTGEKCTLSNLVAAYY